MNVWKRMNFVEIQTQWMFTCYDERFFECVFQFKLAAKLKCNSNIRFIAEDVGKIAGSLYRSSKYLSVSVTFARARSDPTSSIAAKIGLGLRRPHWLYFIELKSLCTVLRVMNYFLANSPFPIYKTGHITGKNQFPYDRWR